MVDDGGVRGCAVRQMDGGLPGFLVEIMEGDGAFNRAAAEQFVAAGDEERLPDAGVKTQAKSQGHELFTSWTGSRTSSISENEGTAGFSSTNWASAAAMSMNTPPAMTAWTRLPPRKFFTNGPNVSAAMISGSTMKKLKMPM